MSKIWDKKKKEHIKVQRPECIRRIYNQNMGGGVDKMDFLLSLYTDRMYGQRSGLL